MIKDIEKSCEKTWMIYKRYLNHIMLPHQESKQKNDKNIFFKNLKLSNFDT